ncbi:hypothetical protein PF010_g26181 [Phytophthora fragariae]|uniref:RNA-directed DNA polymerase n=1 Tax=Phytophthora fragariae TaxID=53985 RepID=A0A6G0JYH7_9STRA|nr:hypothetical protein PF010_g26181 [Phytophthora fragariae]
MDELHRGGRAHARHLTREEAEAAELVLPYATEALKKRKHRRKRQRVYDYHSGSHYQEPVLGSVEGRAQSVRIGKLRAARTPAIDLLPTATVLVRNEMKPVKIDTGAQYSVAGREWGRYGTKLDVLAPVDYREGFSGVAVRVLGVWRFDFLTQYQQRMQVDALLVESDTPDFLIGEDWMYTHGVKINFLASEIKWYAEDEKVVVPFAGIGTAQTPGARTAKVRLLKQTKVVTQTMRRVHMAVEAPDGAVGMFVPRSRRQRYLFLAPTMTKVRAGQITVPVLSLAGRTTKLPTRETLGTWAPVDSEMEIIEMNGDLERDKVERWIKDVLKARVEPLINEADLSIGEMADDDRQLLLQLLLNYPSTIEPRKGCPPMTTLGVEHEIHTGDAVPIKVRPRRHAHSEQVVVDTEVENMLNDGVIEESNGAWGFPVVLVRKKDGTVRFCIDYRLLNAVTAKDVYPSPRIDETLESMYGARRFSSLDLHAGYWQVPVAAKDRDKTGFVTRKGLFRFARMPFGLANAPGTFQSMMDAVLRGLAWQCCLVYLDDVIIFTKGSVARHVVALASVLERLSKAGLSLKAAKCSFATTRLEYLSHELDLDGIRPMESLVKSVREFPVPEDETALKRFVHLAGFYRRFIAGFGTKAAPLTGLLRKSSAWEWGEKQTAAFEGLKQELTVRPLLAYPDFSRPFKLVTDASIVGLGAALMQDQGRGEQPIAFASKVNSPTVAKYDITDLECAAVVWAIKGFRPYLYGRRFELVTDHSALSWLMRSKDLTGLLHRWALQLQEYNFDITYRPGSINVVADALSRARSGKLLEADNRKVHLQEPNYGPQQRRVS